MINYFKKYQWKNAEYGDFIGELKTEFDRSKGKSMGPKFNFTAWSDSWLTTSGINTLEPVIKYNQDESIQSLAIKQLVDPVGMNKLRKFKIDVGIYDNDYNLHVLNDVLLSSKDEIINIDPKKLNTTYSGPVKAVILNHGDHGYAKVRFDEATMENLVNDGL